MSIEIDCALRVRPFELRRELSLVAGGTTIVAHRLTNSCTIWRPGPSPLRSSGVQRGWNCQLGLSHSGNCTLYPLVVELHPQEDVMLRQILVSPPKESSPCASTRSEKF